MRKGNCAPVILNVPSLSLGPNEVYVHVDQIGAVYIQFSRVLAGNTYKNIMHISRVADFVQTPAVSCWEAGLIYGQF